MSMLTRTPPPAAPAGVRRTTVTTVRWAGAVVTAVLLTAGTAGVVAGFFTRWDVSTTIAPAGVTRVVTTAQVGDVVVRGGPAGQPVRVQARRTWTTTRPEVTETTQDGVLSLSTRCQDTWLLDRCSVDLDVTVPPGTAVDLTVVTGDLRVSDVDGPVSAVTTTGDVRVTGAVRGERLTIRAVTGDVRVEGDGSGATVGATARTGDIRVSLDGVPAAVTGTTITGDVLVQVPPGQPYAVEAGTRVGDTVITVPRNPQAPQRIVATSTTGDVRVLGTGDAG
jgi:hypothetical protein